MANLYDTRPAGLHTNAQPVTEREWKPEPVERAPSDPRDMPLDFVLTPQERTQAAIDYCAMQAHVRRLNRLDTAQAVADELVRRDP